MKKKYFSFLLITLIIYACEYSSNKTSTNVVNENKQAIEKEITIILNSDDLMKFDQNILIVKTGQKIALTLNHSGRLNKSLMGHNFVLLKKDVDITDFAERAIKATENEYIPEGDETIAYTKLIGGGESDTITFDAPEKGVYTYICSFPGHYLMMRGKFIVN
ncbi:MAG: azurin [Flavobacteriaceae bacterium]|nr:azurin [Flavobacteriaceae bacterium]|tara:strand:- start:29649 stop:30134 length:486 start_codon:yes stop_codon:yes gene_type:complete